MNATVAVCGLAFVAWVALVSEPRTQPAVAREALVATPELKGQGPRFDRACIACERRPEGQPMEATQAMAAVSSPEPMAFEPISTHLASLELRILSPHSGWFATISGEQPAFMVGGRPSWSGQAKSASRVATDWFAEGSGRATFADAPGDSYVFTGLRPGVPFCVGAADRWKLPITCIPVEPLAPGELRVVELPVDGHLRNFRGEVYSPEGEPIPGARVFISQRDEPSGRGCLTNSEGKFDFKGIGCDELVLHVSARGYANLVNVEFPVSEAPVRLILDRGREVQVQVRSACGAAVTDAYLIARLPGAGYAHSAYGSTDDEGLCLIDRVAAVDLPLEVNVSGRMFTAALGADETLLHVEVPPRQACRVHFVGERAKLESTQLRARLTPLDLECAEDLVQAFEGGAFEAEFGAIFPGRYRAVLELRRDRELLSAGRPFEFEAVAGQSTAIYLDL